jgi:hypothetical protein
MKTNMHLRSHLAEFFLELKMFQTNFKGKKTHFMFNSLLYFSKSCRSKYFFFFYYYQSEGLQSIFKLMCGRDTVAWWGEHPAMSPQVSCKSKGQHLFSLLLYAGCSSGSSIGLGWSSCLVWCFPILSWMTSCTLGTFEVWVKCMICNIPGRICYGSENFDWVLCMMTMWDLLFKICGQIL